MIKLTKIDINPDSEVFQAATIEEYRKSLETIFDEKSPPIDYWIIGELLTLEEGKPMVVDRHNRNGIEIRGVFSSSSVKKIDRKDQVVYITTANSLYKMEYV